MDKKILIGIVVVIVVLVALCASYFLFFSQPQYKNITMNGITLEVPDSNVTVNQEKGFYSTYNDTSKHICVFVLDSTNIGLDDLTEAFTFAALRDTFQEGATLQNKDGHTYNYTKSTDVYSYVGNYTHKNILILTRSEEDLLHMLDTIKVNEDLTLNITNDTQQTTTSQGSQKSQTKSKSSEREEDKVTPDGWDPKKHEVSRQKLEDGYERVDFDDGYHRIVDSKGNIITYGY